MTLKAAYLNAKESVRAFVKEWEWQASVKFEEITPQGFLAELGWVIINSGFRASVARKLWPRIRAAFLEFEDLQKIERERYKCINAAMKIFGHHGKLLAIAKAVQRVNAEPWPELKARIARDPIKTLQWFPYIGPITACHLAKNIGFPVAKPDRHMVRLASLAGYKDVQEFCKTISKDTGDPVPLVDMVLWRFAEQNQGTYLERFGGWC